MNDKNNESSSIFDADVSYAPHNKEKYWEKRLVKALTLITIGVVLLLNTTNQVSWSIWWELLKFWPVLIVVVGVKILLGFSRLTKAVAAILGYVVFVIFLFFAAVNTNSGIFAGTSMYAPKVNALFDLINWQTDNMNINSEESILTGEYPEVTSQKIEIKQDIGKMNLNVGTDNTVLFTTSVRATANNDSFKLEKESQADTLVTSVASTHVNNWFVFYSGPTYDYVVSNLLPLKNLSLDLSAGQGNITLDNNLNIAELNAKVGAGELVFNIANNAVPKEMTFDVGAGNMVITLASDTAYCVKYNVSVGNLEVQGMSDSAGIDREGEYYSPGWDTATVKTTLNVKVGVGNFTLQVK